MALSTLNILISTHILTHKYTLTCTLTYTLMHIHMYTCPHTVIHIHIYTFSYNSLTLIYSNTYTHLYTPICSYTIAYTYIHTSLPSHTFTDTQYRYAYIHLYTHIHIHTRTHTHSHMYTHSHTFTHSHIFTLSHVHSRTSPYPPELHLRGLFRVVSDSHLSKPTPGSLYEVINQLWVLQPQHWTERQICVWRNHYFCPEGSHKERTCYREETIRIRPRSCQVIIKGKTDFQK